jgi:nitrogen fixation NifU-like protein
MLTDELVGMTLDQVRAYGKDDLLELIGLPLDKNPVRLKCALLSLKALKAGVYTYLGQQHDMEELD